MRRMDTVGIDRVAVVVLQEERALARGLALEEERGRHRVCREARMDREAEVSS